MEAGRSTPRPIQNTENIHAGTLFQRPGERGGEGREEGGAVPMLLSRQDGTGDKWHQKVSAVHGVVVAGGVEEVGIAVIVVISVHCSTRVWNSFCCVLLLRTMQL